MRQGWHCPRGARGWTPVCVLLHWKTAHKARTPGPWRCCTLRDDLAFWGMKAPWTTLPSEASSFYSCYVSPPVLDNSWAASSEGQGGKKPATASPCLIKRKSQQQKRKLGDDTQGDWWLGTFLLSAQLVENCSVAFDHLQGGGCFWLLAIFRSSSAQGS